MGSLIREEIPLDRICGLCPEVWLSVGAGFSREDVKALILGQGRGFVGDAIVTLQEICSKITGITKDRMLSPTSRQEVLRTLLAEPRIIAELKELKRIKRQRNFIRRLDLAIQSGRMTSAHEQEEEVYHDRLTQTLGENPLRLELQSLSRAYEAWILATGHFDIPLLIREGIRVLRENGWPESLEKPQEIWSLSAENLESLEQDFWETLGHSVTIKQIQSLSSVSEKGFGLDTKVNPNTWFRWHRWHTLDDAAEHFADQLVLHAHQNHWKDHVVLIPDIPLVRRSLNRALRSRNLPLADPRDPTRLRWDELLKWALLPLEVVAGSFDRKKVVSWLRTYHGPCLGPYSGSSHGTCDETGSETYGDKEGFSVWVDEIHARGIRHGLFSYSGGLLTGVHSKLTELDAVLGGRKTIKELSEAHLNLLKTTIGLDSNRTWLIPFFESTWKVFFTDFERIGQGLKKAPLLFWLERLQARLTEASPPVERLKPEFGIRIYRLQQAPLFPAKKVWFFGLPPYWLSGEGLGNYWFSERERELLSAEFAVRSSIQVREERLTILKSWMAESDEVTVLDAHYHANGRECESILPVLKELELSMGIPIPDEPVDKGAHPRYVKSFGVLRPLQPQEVLLPPLVQGPGQAGPVLTATILEHYSRCPFLSLTYHRWNLKDVREPDIELWPEVKGKMLHEAARLLLESLDSNGSIRLDSQSALESAWKRHRPKGLIRNPRVERYVKSRMVLVLEHFREKEIEYLKKSGARPYSLENLDFKVDYGDFSVIGKPDRIDQHPDGLFVIDFKSGGVSPHGSEMIERGYRLQLPFYAIAAHRQLNQPVLGLQFVELTRKGNRRNGIFFKSHNGKEPGKLTNVRSNSKSLILSEPQEVWSKTEKFLIQNAKGYIQGQFQAKPNTDVRDKECARCRVADLCGRRRLVSVEEKVSEKIEEKANDE